MTTTPHRSGSTTGPAHRIETVDVRSLRAGAVTAVDACSRRSFERHVHDEFGVGLMTAGAQRSWSGRGPVEAVRGNLITVNPNELHDGSPMGSHRSWSMLYFSQDLVSALIADTSEQLRSVRELDAPVVVDARLANLFVATRAAALQPHGAAAFEERMLMLFGKLFGAVRDQRGTPDSVAVARGRIDDAPAQAHPLDELAASAGLSRFQTVRAFARLTGLTPHAYVIQRRLHLARRLIRHGSGLADAAAAAGFSDQSHMHRVFVSRYGFTPGAYASAFRSGSAISFKS